MAERKNKPRPAGEHHGTYDSAEGVAITPADEPVPELTARGVFYRGTTPGTTEFSGALFDSHGQVLARQLHAIFAFRLQSSKRGRPPKSAREALGLVAAFEVDMCKQQNAGCRVKKWLARESRGYSDDRSARTALAAARKKVDQLLPKANWEGVYLPEDPFDYGRLPPEIDGQALRGIWFVGEGDSPKLGEVWHGRAIVVMIPEGFKPRERTAAVHWVDHLDFKDGG